jgi:hypothetical protein
MGHNSPLGADRSRAETTGSGAFRLTQRGWFFGVTSFSNSPRACGAAMRYLGLRLADDG